MIHYERTIRGKLHKANAGEIAETLLILAREARVAADTIEIANAEFAVTLRADADRYILAAHVYATGATTATESTEVGKPIK